MRSPLLILGALLGLALVAVSAGPAAAEVKIDSRTMFLLFEREDSRGENHAVAPVYEYLGLEWGALEDKGLSVHFYGWGRYDFGDQYFDDRSEVEALDLYVQYTREENNFLARLGRQQIYDGVSNESIDGLRVSGDLTDYFAASAYAGLPRAFEDENGRGGDRAFGGRVANHWGTLYELGVSYKRLDDDGARQAEELGVDSSLRLGGWGTFHGTSVLNLITDDWREHAYEIRVPLGSVALRGLAEHYDYRGYFYTGDQESGPFPPLAQRDEVYGTFGGDLTWFASDSVSVTWLSKIYSYDERDDGAWYNTLDASYRWAESSDVGGEVGWMNGGTPDTRYLLGRGYWYWSLGSGFVSGDVMVVRYDEEILGEDLSTFTSLSAGHRLLDDTLELSLSGDYGSDPYFDNNFRVMLIAQYRFGR